MGKNVSSKSDVTGKVLYNEYLWKKNSQKMETVVNHKESILEEHDFGKNFIVECRVDVIDKWREEEMQFTGLLA